VIRQFGVVTTILLISFFAKVGHHASILRDQAGCPKVVEESTHPGRKFAQKFTMPKLQPKQGKLAEAEDLYRHVLNGLIQLYGFSAAVEEGWQCRFVGTPEG